MSFPAPPLFPNSDFFAGDEPDPSESFFVGVLASTLSFTSSESSLSAASVGCAFSGDSTTDSEERHSLALGDRVTFSTVFVLEEEAMLASTSQSLSESGGADFGVSVAAAGVAVADLVADLLGVRGVSLDLAFFGGFSFGASTSFRFLGGRDELMPFFCEKYEEYKILNHSIKLV